MKKPILSAVIVATAIAFPGLVPHTAVAEQRLRTITYFVKQDFSNCVNADVKPDAPAVIGGEALVALRDGGKFEVNVRLTKVAPNTTYNVFLKCHYLLGGIKTDENGRGNNTFSFPASDSGPVFAFDMYPEGSPPGNKYQSVQINFQ